jgi:hypothetical protein
VDGDLLMPNGKRMMYCTEEVRRDLPEDGVGARGRHQWGTTPAVNQW